MKSRRSFLKNLAATTAAATGCSWMSGRFGTAASAASGPGDVVRPPGALPEGDFLATCIRCLRCVEACPNQAILPLGPAEGPRAATPAIQTRRQACMLCNDVPGEFLKCTEACPSGALQKIRKAENEVLERVDMGTAQLDLALCYSYNNWSCGACYRACPFPEKAMTLGLWERPEVNAEACIGCGLCERACIRYPQAIRVVPRRAV